MSLDAPVEGFEVGREATLQGVRVEVLGWARWRTADGYPWHEVTLRTEDAERWTLELDAGHVLLSRELPGEDLGDPEAPADGRTTTDLDGRKRLAWGMAHGRLEKVQGEYWKDLEPGDHIMYRAFYAPPTVVSASRERYGDPWEWTQGVYVDPAEVEEAFGVRLPRPDEPHPARPFPYRAWTRALGPVLALVGLASLVASIALATGPGRVVLDERIQAKQKADERFVGLFDLEQPAVVGIAVGADGLYQSWAEVGALVAPPPPEGTPPESFQPDAVGSYITELSYYEGVDSDGRWVESHMKESEGFRLGRGTWMVRLGWEIDPKNRSPVTLRVRVMTGYREVGPLRVWGILCLVGAVLFYVARRVHRQHVMVEAGLVEGG
ncbi:MAG: DUF4178 domain-containing protein [Myxococcota bacterium]